LVHAAAFPGLKACRWGAGGRNKLRPSRREGRQHVNGSIPGVAATGETPVVPVNGAHGVRALPVGRNLAGAQERDPHAAVRDQLNFR